MIYGIGVDTVQISRVAHGISNPRFVRRVYSTDEQALFAGQGDKRAAELAAGCFAAKEAFLKAAGRGLGGFQLADIAALRRESGAPYYRLGGAAAQWAKAEGLTASLSITHEAGLATALAVLERAEEQ